MEKILFTSESVSEGHPDKVCDQISDAILDACLKEDPYSRVACECFTTTDLLVIGGEITTNAKVNYEEIARGVLRKIGYTSADLGIDCDNCRVEVVMDSQSSDIALGTNVEVGGAGDQGIMFGFACNETEGYMPLPVSIAHHLVRYATEKRHAGEFKWARPDMKSQVTVDYTDPMQPRIDTILMSIQHDDDFNEVEFKDYIQNVIMKEVVKKYDMNTDYKVYINPTGRFVIGGPHGDTGLTGRKIIVDTYGGSARHGGGAFSGKDPSKVDRSAAYAARHIAKNLVAAGVADEMLVQVSYAIGVAKPMNIFVNTFGRANVKMTDGEIAEKIWNLFDMRPKAIEERLKLRNPIYLETASYGHMGRKPQVVTKTFTSRYNPEPTVCEVELFTWEKLDYVDKVKEAFGL